MFKLCILNQFGLNTLTLQGYDNSFCTAFTIFSKLWSNYERVKKACVIYA